MNRITSLPAGHIFVFGSNLAGRHGKGAARDAALYFGAHYGVGEGRTGYAYALPTKDSNLVSLPLPRIKAAVERFLNFASDHPELVFVVTPIGCGLAGYTPAQIAPLFVDSPYNVVLPPEFKNGQKKSP